MGKGRSKGNHGKPLRACAEDTDIMREVVEREDRNCGGTAFVGSQRTK
jgi:hypothetical protein